VSPSSSSFIPRILRNSFSKILHRNRARTPDRRESQQQTFSDSDSCSVAEEILDQTLPTPETEEVVRESIKEGLPIIPFAYPTFFTVNQRQEEDTKQRRSSVRKNFQLPTFVKNSGEVEEDSIFLMDDDNDNEGDLHQSLDSIVRRAKFEMENKVHPRKESQSSYVEMCLNNEFENEDNQNNIDEESDYFMMDKRRPTLSDISIYNSVPLEILSSKKQSKEKGSLIENEICRRFKKANRHKDDYVMFDFESNNNGHKEDYVEMGFSKKWHFLDFSKKCK